MTDLTRHFIESECVRIEKSLSRCPAGAQYRRLVSVSELARGRPATKKWKIEHSISPFDFYNVNSTNLRMKSQPVRQRLREIDRDHDRICKWGDEMDCRGLLNLESLAPKTARAGNRGRSEWSSKTGPEILSDINDAIQEICEGEVPEDADTVLLPHEQYQLIATRSYWCKGRPTILEILKQGNIYTASTNKQLKVIGVMKLESAAVAKGARMVVYANCPDVLQYHQYLDFAAFSMDIEGSRAWGVTASTGTTGLRVKNPNAIKYVDGI